MYILLFFLFAFFTIFLSIKLSIYSDKLSSSFNISKAFIGGILLAGVTSLPEFATSISAVTLGNPSLAIGDILGSNVFNIFIICVFDFILFNKRIFNNTKRNNNKIYFLLIIGYSSMLLCSILNINSVILGIGIPSIVVLLVYLYYLFFVTKGNDEVAINDYKKDKYLVIKLIITAVFMVIFSILLTNVVNKIAIMYPKFSDSLIGAVLLGVTTSLPEVVTFYALVMINSYDLALANIIGSNLFNLFVLGISDFVLVGNSIYDYMDFHTLILLVISIIYTFIVYLQNSRDIKDNKFWYFSPSFVVVLAYVLFWYLNFII